MLHFKKDPKIKNNDLEKLSEEDIQRKLYGTYKPGTLGNVVKISKDDIEEQKHKKEEPVAVEPSLFEDDSLFDDDLAEVEDLKIDLTEEIIASDALANSNDTSTVGSDIKTEYVLRDIVSVSGQDDIVQLDSLETARSVDEFSSAKDDRYSSFKLTINEIWDSMRLSALKYFLFGGIILVGVIFIFNIISTYVVDDTVGTNQNTVILPDVSVQSSVESSSKTKEVFDQENNIQSSNNEKASSVRNVLTVPVVSIPRSTTTQAQRAHVSPASHITDTQTPNVSPSTKKYTVQICVSNDKAATNDLVADIADLGFDAFYRKTTTRSGKTLFFIFVGKFASVQDANSALQKYRKTQALKKYSDSFVTKIKN